MQKGSQPVLQSGDTSTDSHHKAPSSSISTLRSTAAPSSITTTGTTDRYSNNQPAGAQMAQNLECPICSKALDGSFRTMAHALCGLRYCCSHLQQLTATSKLCQRCKRELVKEDFMTVPSLSSSQRASNNPVKEIQPTRLKLMSSLGGSSSTALQSQNNDGAPLYECPICNLGRLEHKQLLDHSKQHANIPGKCPICAFLFNKDYFSKHLYGHLMLRHKNSKKSGAQSRQQEIHTVDIIPENVKQQISSKYAMQNQSQLHASKGTYQSSSTSTSKAKNQSQSHLKTAGGGGGNKAKQINMGRGAQESVSTLPSQSQREVLSKDGQKEQQQTMQNVQTNMMLLKTQNYHSSNNHAPLREPVQKCRSSSNQRQSLTATPPQLISTQQSMQKQMQLGDHHQPNHPAAQKNQSKKQQSGVVNGGANRPINLHHLREKSQHQQQIETLPFSTNQHLTQGLLGIYTFSAVSVNGSGQDTTADEQLRLELTSRYTCEKHKKSLMRRRQSQAYHEPFKLTDFSKYLDPLAAAAAQAVDRARSPVSQNSHTDDGLSSESSHESSSSSNQDGVATTKDSPMKPEQLMSKHHGKSKLKLKPPVYLEEIEKICYPFEKVPHKKVTLQKDARLVLDGSNSTLSNNHESGLKYQRPLSPDPHHNQLNQSSHQQPYTSTNKKFSFSPTSQQNKGQLASLIKGGGGNGGRHPKDASSASGNVDQKDKKRQASVPRLNQNLQKPHMMPLKQGLSSPKGHCSTRQIPELNFREYENCTLEETQKFYKMIYYTTRTADDSLQFLSILVCAQPHIKEEQRDTVDNDKQDMSDAIISDEDEEDLSNGLKAQLRPFVLVVVTSRPVFESALGGQILELIYQHCFMPLYRRISFQSPLLAQQFVDHKAMEVEHEISDNFFLHQLPLEKATSILFDLMNVFSASKEDSFRHVSWMKPINGQPETFSLLQANQIFQTSSYSSLLLHCNQSLARLLTAVQPENIIKLYSCMLLEKKIVLIAKDQTFQEDLAPIIEALLSLFAPLDSQVFSNVSYALSEEMVFYMEKPGSIVMGMPQHLWTSHGRRVFEQSFDTYIVVFDLESQQFHLKIEDDPIGLPRTFSKLLRRSFSAIDTVHSDIYTTFQIRQAFFNTLLLIISSVKAMEAKEKEKRQLRVKEKKQIDVPLNERESVSDSDSANSVQTFRGGKHQYPFCKAFLREFKSTTAFIDLSDKLEKKKKSVAYVNECLGIIEKQKLDWFDKLLEHQVSKVASEIAYFSRLFCPENFQTSPMDNQLQELELSDVLAAFDDDHSQAQQQAQNVFVINGRRVSKSLRARLYQLKSIDQEVRVTHAASQSQQVAIEISPSSVPAERKGGGAAKTNQIVLFDNNFSGAVGAISQGRETPHQGYSSARKEFKSPSTPEGHQAVRAFGIGQAAGVESGGGPKAEFISPRAARVPRYGSTHKPQIDFKQVRSSQSPLKENEAAAEEKKESQTKAATPTTGFFSLISNFFSSNKVGGDGAGTKESPNPAATSEQPFWGRKASKSMQVMQPQFMNFVRPIDMQEVAKIKTLCSGMQVLQAVHQHNESANAKMIKMNTAKSLATFQETPKHSNQPIKQPDQSQSKHDYYLLASHVNQNRLSNINEANSFVKESSVLLYSGSKPQETPQFAYTPHKATPIVPITERYSLHSNHKISSNEAYFFDKKGNEYQKHKTATGTAEHEKIQSQMFQDALNQIGAPSHSKSMKLHLKRKGQEIGREQGKGGSPGGGITSLDYVHSVAAHVSSKTVLETASFHAKQVDHPQTVDYISRTDVPQQPISTTVRQSHSSKKQFKHGQASQDGFLSARQRESQPVSPNTSGENSKEDVSKGSHSRPSFPFAKATSPSITSSLFWSAPNDAVQTQKRFSLNPIRVQKQPSSSTKGSGNVTSSNRVSDVGQNTNNQGGSSSFKSVTVVNSDSIPASSQTNRVKKATINLDVDLSWSKLDNSGGGGAASQSNFISVTSSSKQAAQSSRQSDQLHKLSKIETEKAPLNTSQQKLKITISKLQSKQIQGQTRLTDNSSTIQSSLQLAQQISHSSSALSFSRLQKQGGTMRQLKKQCISPKISSANPTSGGSTTFSLQNSNMAAGLNQGLTSKNSGVLMPPKRLSGAGHFGGGDSAKAQQLKQQKQLSQSSQNLQGSSSQLRRSQLLTGDMVLGSRKDHQVCGALAQSRKEGPRNKAEDLSSSIGKEKASKRAMAGTVQASQAHLFSPKQSTSPKGEVFKYRRPKAFSQLQRGVQQQEIQQPHQSSKQATQQALSNAQSRLGLVHQSNSVIQTVALQPAGSLVHQGMTSLHSHSVTIGNSSTILSQKQNETVSSTGRQVSGTNPQKDVLHSILKKGMQKQTQNPSANSRSGSQDHHFQDNIPLSGQTNKKYVPYDSLIEKSKSYQRLQLPGQSVSSMAFVKNQYKENQLASGGNRNSMTSLPEAKFNLASQSQVIMPGSGSISAASNTQQAKFKIQKVDPTSQQKEQPMTPSDFGWDSSKPKLSRRQQKLTQVAEEKKGDEEHVEMENIQEVLESGLESNRIRSISHQPLLSTAFNKTTAAQMKPKQ